MYMFLMYIRMLMYTYIYTYVYMCMYIHIFHNAGYPKCGMHLMPFTAKLDKSLTI